MNKQIKFKKNLIFKRILFIILLVITFYVIFNFSAQNGQDSGSLSKKVTEYIVKIFSKIKDIDDTTRLNYIEKLHPYVRKLAHFSIYTVVGFSVMGFFCTFNIRNRFKLLWSLVIGVSYAISDEVHQYFIPQRSARVLDVCIDSMGVITGILIMIFIIIIFESLINWIKR